MLHSFRISMRISSLLKITDRIAKNNRVNGERTVLKKISPHNFRKHCRKEPYHKHPWRVRQIRQPEYHPVEANYTERSAARINNVKEHHNKCADTICDMSCR